MQYVRLMETSSRKQPIRTAEKKRIVLTVLFLCAVLLCAGFHALTLPTCPNLLSCSNTFAIAIYLCGAAFVEPALTNESHSEYGLKYMDRRCWNLLHQWNVVDWSNMPRCFPGSSRISSSSLSYNDLALDRNLSEISADAESRTVRAVNVIAPQKYSISRSCRNSLPNVTRAHFFVWQHRLCNLREGGEARNSTQEEKSLRNRKRNRT